MNHLEITNKTPLIPPNLRDNEEEVIYVLEEQKEKEKYVCGVGNCHSCGDICKNCSDCHKNFYWFALCEEWKK